MATDLVSRKGGGRRVGECQWPGNGHSGVEPATTQQRLVGQWRDFVFGIGESNGGGRSTETYDTIEDTAAWCRKVTMIGET